MDEGHRNGEGGGWRRLLLEGPQENPGEDGRLDLLVVVW